MPQKFNEVLTSMVTQSGIDVATMKEIIDNPAFASIEVNDEIVTKLTTPRFTMDAAKNNPDLHKHFQASILNGLDKKIEDSATSFGLTADEITELKSEKSSYERAILLAKKVQSLEAKKQVAPDEQKKIFTKEIADLNKAIVDLKGGFETEKTTLLNTFESEKLNWRMDNLYSEFVPQMNKDIKPSINQTIAKQTVAEALHNKGLKIVNKEGNLTLVTEVGGDYYEDSKKLSLKDFISKTLANEKLLTVSKGTPQQNDKRQVENRTPSNNGSGDKNTSKFMDKIGEYENAES